MVSFQIARFRLLLLLLVFQLYKLQLKYSLLKVLIPKPVVTRQHRSLRGAVAGDVILLAELHRDMSLSGQRTVAIGGQPRNQLRHEQHCYVQPRLGEVVRL
jgi:hypothetical protein